MREETRGNKKVGKATQERESCWSVDEALSHSVVSESCASELCGYGVDVHK